MSHELSSLATRRSEAQAVNDVIEAPFDEGNEILTRHSTESFGLAKIIAELLFQDPIGPLHLLFFAELNGVIGRLDPPLTMLSRRICPLLNGTFAA
jgi:hypothetical protein